MSRKYKLDKRDREATQLKYYGPNQGIVEVRRCQAWGRRRQIQCRNTPVRGLNVCRMHGGGQVGKRVAINPCGVYVLGKRKELATLYQSFRNDPKLTSLREESALLKAMLAERLASEDLVKHCKCPNCKTKLKVRFPNPLSAGELLDQVRSMVLALNQIEKGFEFYIHVDQLNTVVQQLNFVIGQFIPDEPAIREKLATELRKLSLPSAS